MNILFISPNSPFESIGGVERYITNLINYCKGQSRSKIIIVLPSFGENHVDEVGNVTMYFSKSIGLPKNISVKEVSERAKLFSKEIEKIIMEHSVDVICAENFHVGLPAAYNIQLNMVAGLNNIPLVLRVHSFASTDLQSEIVNQLMWKKISCVSKSVTGDCFQKGADIDILSTDYLGVDVNEFNSEKKSDQTLRGTLGLKPENKIILTATRIIHGRKPILQEKGLINLTQAFSKLSPRFPNLRLLIAVGKAPDILKNEFEQAYNTLYGYLKLNNVETRTIVKMFPLNQMPLVYRESDVFTLPSENETFGQVFIEAMSCGLPVIGTKVGGTPEIISDSYNGFLIPPNDSSILAQMIDRLLKDNSIRDRFIHSGRNTVNEKFTAQKQFDSFISMLEEISLIK